jgi:hypothetical protein
VSFQIERATASLLQSSPRRMLNSEFPQPRIGLDRHWLAEPCHERQGHCQTAFVIPVKSGLRRKSRMFTLHDIPAIWEMQFLTHVLADGRLVALSLLTSPWTVARSTDVITVSCDKTIKDCKPPASFTKTTSNCKVGSDQMTYLAPGARLCGRKLVYSSTPNL